METGPPTEPVVAALRRLALAGVLCNRAFVGHRGAEWVHHGDAVDVALLVLGHKLGLSLEPMLEKHPEVAALPFEAELRYSTSLHRADSGILACMKGAPEVVLPHCVEMQTADGCVPLEADQLMERAHALAAKGYRVLAFASGLKALDGPHPPCEECLEGLTFLGLVGMIDPLRNGRSCWASPLRCS